MSGLLKNLAEASLGFIMIFENRGKAVKNLHLISVSALNSNGWLNNNLIYM